MPKKQGNYINIFGVPRVGVVGDAGTFFGGGKVGHYEFLQSLVGSKYDQSVVSEKATTYYGKERSNPKKYWGQIITLFNFIGVRAIDENDRIINNNFLDFIYNEYEKNNILPAEAFFHYLLCTFQYPHPSITENVTEKYFDRIKPYKIILELLVELNEKYNKNNISYADIVWLHSENYINHGNFLSKTPVTNIANRISNGASEESNFNDEKLKSISYFRSFLECSNLLISDRKNKNFTLKYDIADTKNKIKAMQGVLDEFCDYDSDSPKRKREYDFSQYIYSESKINEWLIASKLYGGLKIESLVGENAKKFSITKYTKEKLKQQLDRIDNFDTPTIVKRRSEQHILRNMVFMNQSSMECVICGKSFPIEALTAAHIKKRSLCTDDEKKDTNVVMPACLIGCDYLYEKGYIVVKNNQILENITNKKITENLKEIINERVGNIRESSGSFSYSRSKSYFDYHRKINRN